MLQFVIACGVIAVLYGIFASRSILAASAGTERMQEIAGAIQEGAKAYLNRQYRTIGMAGIVVAVILFFTLGSQAAIGFLIGAILSGAAGYVGMLISVRANVRTTEASRQGLAQGLSISFKSGAVTGMLVAGFDPETNGYTLMHVHPCPDASQFLNMEPSSEFQTGEAYLNHLYQTGDTLLAKGSLDEVLELAARWTERPDALFPPCD